jgi:hypothetical protein
MGSLLRRLLVPVAVLALTAACGATSTSHQPPNRVTPPSSDATATASVAATISPGGSPTATATPNVPITAVDFSCRLPVVTTRNQTAEAGFITFPGGSYAADPAGAIKSKAYGLAYDRAYSRWLPVDWRLVSDDGAHYVYVTYSGDTPAPGAYSSVHVVDVATGADRVVSRNGQYVVNDYVGTSVYLSPWVGGHDGPGPQIGWVLDPATGRIRALGGKGYGYWIGSGAGWRTDYNTADPTVHQGMTGPNRLIRVDLATGAEATWFYQQGSDGVQLLAFDRAGHPIVSSGTGQVDSVLLLTDASHVSQLFSTGGFIGGPLADAHGIWFTDGSATYLYTAGSGLRKVASTGGQIAGGCH